MERNKETLKVIISYFLDKKGRQINDEMNLNQQQNLKSNNYMKKVPDCSMISFFAVSPYSGFLYKKSRMTS